VTIFISSPNQPLVDVTRKVPGTAAHRPAAGSSLLTIMPVSVDSPEDLYGLELDRFVPARAALVKRLRGEKRREEASEVAALRKPSVAAWAVNQLVRTEPKALQALFEAGDDLARAQAQAAAGKGGGDAMRGATHRQREAVGELVAAAEGLLSSEGQGVSQATIERVGETLRAAANDENARRQVTGGCLTRELRFVGLGIGALPPSTAKSKRSAKTKPAREPAEAERVAARERAAALKAARRTEAEARRAATRAQKELAAAQARQEEAAAAAHRRGTTSRGRGQQARGCRTGRERPRRALATELPFFYCVQ
jgi:hypothetical protein